MDLKIYVSSTCMSPLNASSMWTQKSPPSQNIYVFSISWLSQLIAVDKLLSMLIKNRIWEQFCEFSFMQCPKPFASWFIEIMF